jgi:glycosyltransferase involved in cell wall biosynthesis
VSKLLSSISLVIPARNEAENITAVVQGAQRSLHAISDDWEIVLVDDASTDGTVAVARRALGAEGARLTVVPHDGQRGYAATVCDGLSAARGDYLAFMDGDGQFDAADLRKLVTRLERADFVTGCRAHRADPAHRSVISGVFNILVRTLYGVRVRDVDCGLKVMRREVFLRAQPIVARSAVFNTEMFFKAQRNGYRIAQVSVPHYPRTAGVHAGARVRPILRAVRDLVRVRLALAGGDATQAR